MEATHFIELYKHHVGENVETGVIKIKLLENFLLNTTRSGGYTIAIFKIKYK